MSQERVDSLFAGESWSAVYTAFTNVSLKAYDFDTLREALLVYIKQTYPDKYNDFIASSEFVAILDLVAYLGHALSYRLDMNTRENFMDLAERKESILRMAKTLGYNKTRPINGRGFMKITSVKTDQNIFDSNGVSLANRVIKWNDANNTDWYENFITVVNTTLDSNTKIENPKSTISIEGVVHNIYEINENKNSKSVVYPFKGSIAGANRNFEAVPVTFNDKTVVERYPDRSMNFTIINRDDNLGPASDRTGFFVFAKSGKLTSDVFSYNVNITNRVQTIATSNISNTDVWVQKVDTSGNIINEVTKLDNDTRETAIYNAIRTGSGDMVSIKSTVENGIELHYPDGIFGNSAFGNYRVWYRVVDNESFSIDRNSMKDIPIVIPYIGADGVAYRLTLTISSTRDFGENYQAENYVSVRRIAPRSYYAQDRMVNAQDYNVLPLSLGTNVIKKVKAINTTFSGNSRYFKMDDVLGNHSNVIVNSKDGSVYWDDDNVTTTLRFNRDKGNSVDFIRNSISRVIKHNSLANKFFIVNRKNPNTVISEDTTDLFINSRIMVSATDPKRIEIQVDEDPEYTLPTEVLRAGDFIKIKTDDGNIFWTSIYSPLKQAGVFSTTNYLINNILPQEQTRDDIFQIVEIVKAYRTRFEEEEIIEIKNKALQDLTEFFIEYRYDVDSKGDSRWLWKVSETEPAPTAIYLKLEYNPSERTSEAEYTVTFNGRKVVFESQDDVKFFYGNETKIVDVDTNLAVQDAITFDFFSPNQTETMNTIEYSDSYPMQLGISPIENLNQDGDIVSFDLSYERKTGAPRNLEFIDCFDTHTTISGAKYTLMNEEGNDVYELETTVFPEYDSYTTIIGNHEVWKMSAQFDKVSDMGIALRKIDTVYRETDVEACDDEYTISPYYSLDQSLADIGNVGNVGSVAGNTLNYLTTTCTLTTDSLKTNFFKGQPSVEYFENAVANGTFFIFDDEYANPLWLEEVKNKQLNDSNFEAAPDSSLTREELIASGKALNNSYTFQLLDDTWTFVLTGDPDTVVGNDFNGDYFYWRQFPYCEFSFKSHNCLKHPHVNDDADTHDMVIYYNTDNGKVAIDPIHWEVQRIVDDVDPTCYNYRVIFWTLDPSELGELDVSEVISDELVDLTGYSVRADALIKLVTVVQSTLPIAKTMKSFIYDKFITPNGYIDHTKVKMTTLDSKNNPYGMLTMIGDRKIVLEEYSVVENNVEKVYERVSKTAVVTADPITIQDENVEWYYNPDEPSTLKWHNRYDTTQRLQNLEGKRIVSGMSYVDNSLSNYTWEHYADKDKRIDPSTSNIIDVYVLTADYTRKIEQWKAAGFATAMPKSANNYELKKIMETISGKESISDHVSYIPVKFKPLFGSQAAVENQAIFKVVKKKSTLYTDSEIKSAVSATVNEYFKLENWDFGDTFYFSELAAYLHTKLPEYISSIIITPKYSSNLFKNLLSITCEPNEIFMSVTTSLDVKIIDKITDSELLGE